jgi:hypothetical protein
MITHNVQTEATEQERQMLEVIRDRGVGALPTFDCSFNGRTVHGM